jgi:quinol monooxygenase YgiN
MTILVTGTFDLDPANTRAFSDAASACMAATREEAACESYTFTADLEVAGRFHVTELWASKEGMDEHMASAHLAEFMAAMGGFGITAASLTQWDGATGTKLM